MRINLPLLHLVMVVIEIDFQVLSKVEVILLIAETWNFCLVFPNEVICLPHGVGLRTASAIFEILVCLFEGNKLFVLKSEKPHHCESYHNDHSYYS